MRKTLVRTVLGLGLIGALAAGCGDDDDDVAVDTGMPDTGMMIDGRVADSGVDAALDAAATPTHANQIVVTELTAITGPTTSADIASVSVGINSVTAVPAAAVKAGNPAAPSGPIGQCIGLAFRTTGTPVVPDVNQGNAGNITVTGHQHAGTNGGCTVNPLGLFCAPMTVTCARAGAGTPSSPYTYDCDTPNARAAANDQRSLPVQSFLAESGPGMLTVNVAGGPAMAAFTQTVPVAEDARYTLATLGALSTYDWASGADLTVALNGKQGSGDSFAKTGNDVTLTDAGGGFVSSDVGRMITISGATTAANNGTFTITAVPAGGTTLTYVNAAGVAEAFPGTYAFAGATSGALITRIEMTNGNARPANKTGTGDDFTKTGNDVTLTDAGGAFVAADIGRMITIAGATTAANNGTFAITAQPTATSVTFVNAAGVAEAYPGAYSVAGGGPGLADSPTCTLADKQFPSLGKCGATHYAVLTCVDLFMNSKAVPGAAITATFAEVKAAIPAASPGIGLARVTTIKTANPQMVTVAGTPNRALVAAGQGHVFTDTTP